MDTLSLVTFLPLFGAIAITLMPSRAHGMIRWFALLLSAGVFALSLQLVQGFQTSADMQMEVHKAWLPSLGISYKIGLDGISLFLVMLVTFLTPITILGCFNSIEERVKEFFFCMLLLETAMIGAFVALDLFLFYVFWEAMLIPMYFMIGIWGGERKVYATVKFFIYTMVGSLLMLVAILYVVHQHRVQTGELTFDLALLMGTALSSQQQWLLFLSFALAFAIKVPMFPFHTWLPDAHVEAPTPGSVILAGVLLKMGTYGFIRFAMPMFPEAAIRAIPYIAALSIIGIVYGACVAMVQQDIKKLVAYSSVSHLGFVMLGLFALNVQAVQGAMLGMINHGISTGALFLLVGVIYERRHTRLISEYGGLTRVMPLYTTVFLIVALSSIGLPPLNGFVHEFLILVGSFQANVWWGVLAATGVILGAIYMLWMFQRVFFGEVTNEKNANLKDLTLREGLVFIPLLAMIVWMGVYSKPFTERMEPSITKFVEEMQSVRQAMLESDGELGFTGSERPPAGVAGGAPAAPAGGVTGDRTRRAAFEDGGR